MEEDLIHSNWLSTVYHDDQGESLSKGHVNVLYWSFKELVIFIEKSLGVRSESKHSFRNKRRTMQARHPVTGKPIRILKTETHIQKDRKTLAWLRVAPTEVDHAHRFKRWDTLFTDPSLAEQQTSIFNSDPSAVILREPTDTNLTYLRTKAPKTKTLLFLSRAVIDAQGSAAIAKDEFQNIVCLEEISDILPQVYHKQAPEDSDAMVVLAVGVVFRVARVTGFSEADLGDIAFQEQYQLLKTEQPIEALPHQTPEPLWLIQQWFEPSKPKRAREIRKCLEENLKCPQVDKVLFLNEEEFKPKFAEMTNASKIEEVILGHRMRYSDVLRYIHDKVPAGTLVAFANSDIQLDETWRQVWSVNFENLFLSLLRQDLPLEPDAPLKLFGPRADSQDTWVLSSDSVKAREWGEFAEIDFEFGRAGCDNAINGEMLRKKQKVANPALSLQTVHVHQSQIRTYDPKDIIDKPMQLHLDPTGLHDLEPCLSLSGHQVDFPAAKPFDWQIQSVDEAMLKTFCAMVSRQQNITLKPNTSFTFKPVATEDKAQKFSNSFVTPTGLVQGQHKLQIGASNTMREFWSKTVVSHMTPALGIKSVLAVQFPDDYMESLGKQVQNYLGKVLRLRDAGYTGELWLPRKMERIQEFLQFFSWDNNVIPVIPRDRDVVAFGKDVTLLEPRASALPQKEEIEALRKYCKVYTPTALDHKRVVIFQDDEFLTTDDTNMLEAALEAQGYLVDIVQPSRSSPSQMIQRCVGAKYCIATPSSESYFWLLPKDATVIDIQSDTKMTGLAAHHAAACSVGQQIVLLARMKGEAKHSFLIDILTKSIEAASRSSVKKTITESLPKLIVPQNPTGFHAHSGDTFREVAELWAEQGKVELVRSTETPFCWLGGIGETLLQDRPTQDWLKKSPAQYKKILVGNPDATQVENGTQWSFWGRRPRELEARSSAPLPTYDKRPNTLVFQGKIENNVQLEHRKSDLIKACDDSFCPASPTAAQKYGPTEYLEKLSQAKFGLCQAGQGPKCNREIECFALGTVPVAAPDVDLEHYANPPQEGVHQIRLKSFDPEEAKARIALITQDEWERLSAAGRQWQKENAASDGFWRLTKELAGL